MKSYVSLKPDDMIGHMCRWMVNSTWAVAAPSVKYLETVFYDPATADYGPVATKIMSLNPDVIDATSLHYQEHTMPCMTLVIKAPVIPNLLSPSLARLSSLTAVRRSWKDGNPASTDPR